MVDWIDADFSDRSDSSDEEFVFREEDVAEDTSDSSEDEVSDGGNNSSIANQNTPQHTYGNHTGANTNGNSAATYGDSRYTTPIHTPLANGNGHGLNENGYTNGKIGPSRHRQEHSYLYSPYSTSRRSSGERIDGDEFGGSVYSSNEYNDRNGYTDLMSITPNRPLRELRVPFEIFSDTFNQFHDEQEMTLKELRETEQEMIQMNTLLEEEIETVKEECNDLKTDYRDICDENKQIREYIEEMHSFLLPYFSNIMDDQGDENNEKEVKEMDVDKNNAGDEGSEEKDDESEDDELDEVTLGPFLIELAHRFAQQQQ